MSPENDMGLLLQRPSQKIAATIHFLKAKFRRKHYRSVQALAKFVPADGVILDVGAHFGYFSKEFARIHDASCHVHSFEPVTYTHAILTKVTGSLPNVSIHKFGLSDREDALEIKIPIKKSGHIGPGLAHLGEENSRDYVAEKIAVKTMDGFIAEANLTRLDLIKCDVEGAELLVFRGGAESIARFSPVIFSEIDGSLTKRLGYEPDRIFDFFRDIGYGAHVLNGGVPVPVAGYAGSNDYLFQKKTDQN